MQLPASSIGKLAGESAGELISTVFILDQAQEWIVQAFAWCRCSPSVFRFGRVEGAPCLREIIVASESARRNTSILVVVVSWYNLNAEEAALVQSVAEQADTANLTVLLVVQVQSVLARRFALPTPGCRLRVGRRICQ